MANSQDTTAAPAQGLLDHPLRLRWSLPALAILCALPALAAWMGDEFYVGLASRILIFALAATSLNLILGFGGMVSFGHAAFVGIGAYSVAVLMQAGVMSAWVAWPSAMLISALVALIVGAISLRTQGVYFIMITLAFAQMLYYLVVSLRAYGGDDGMSLYQRSSLTGLDLGDDRTFYYLSLALLVATVVGVSRLLNARFGHVLQAIRENELRMTAIGFPVYRYKLTAFTLAGALAGLAGALLANHANFVSPALMQWSQSGVLMIMVILGGVGHLYGGVIGAIVFLVLEEFMSHYTIHWQLGLGFILLTVVLMAPNGITSLFRRKARA
ncbi:branched-chain amino acid ABC transporter permease [Rhodoferax sp. PAMC 29310]|uniref:branched-chain amino acid ABC transporter permease n=1 Tax=Rhodoferax sp. PAMC 29310 TaxID=2822760 RepID=UPI001B32FCC6|nr:branched-chain amino acid ABC transporter permease [Rhodoferax sp. PAMC 29310]